MTTLEFFFDCSSPWTYLGFTGIRPIARRHGVDIQWRPILVGGVFNQVNPDLYKARESMFNNPQRMRHYQKDLADWAAYYGLRIGQPPVFPVNSVKAMRGCLVARESNRLEDFVQAVFETYWGDLQDISQDDVLAAIVERLGMDVSSFFERINQQEYKDRLRANTDELIARGGYGSPTIFIDRDDMYFGNDRLPLVDWALAGKPQRAS